MPSFRLLAILLAKKTDSSLLIFTLSVRNSHAAIAATENHNVIKCLLRFHAGISS